MTLKDALVNAVGGLFAKKDDEVKKSEIIDTTVIIDSQLPKAMIEELSNGKGEDE